MRVLDLFCGAGGAAMGLHQAWPDAEIWGVDIEPQPHYPFRFIRGDAMDYLSSFDRSEPFDFVWASPPCQHYSQGSHWVRGKQGKKEHPDYIPELRRRLQALQIGSRSVSWVIENVEGAPLISPATLCGSMFGLRCPKGYLKRHRLFESSFPIRPLACQHEGQGVSVCGHGAGGLWGYRKATAIEARELLGINWMNRDELAQAIPPAYSRYIAEQFNLSKELP